jgi:serine/threonine protein kinase
VDPFEVDQALKEIDIMKKFVHPNLVMIHDSSFDEESETLEIIMEYCEDGDLLNYFKKKNKQLEVQEILRIFKQIVQAFIVMNVKGVLHRDLKPENILIAKGAVIKVADFGCARSVNHTEISKIDNFSLDKGTPIYASPEQLKNEKYSFKCDVWSAGCLLYFIYYRNHPFMDQRASRAHNTLTLIKKMTENREIEIEQNTDPTIAKLISLTLIYEDKERASWR